MSNEYKFPLEHFARHVEQMREDGAELVSDADGYTLMVATLERLEALVAGAEAIELTLANLDDGSLAGIETALDHQAQDRRLTELAGRVGETGVLTEECARGECSYYNDYLAFATPGEPNLDHLSYHCAERRYHQAQERFQAWCDEHPGVLPLDHKEGMVLLSLAQEWAKKVRA